MLSGHPIIPSTGDMLAYYLVPAAREFARQTLFWDVYIFSFFSGIFMYIWFKKIYITPIINAVLSYISVCYINYNLLQKENTLLSPLKIIVITLIGSLLMLGIQRLLLSLKSR